MQIQSNLVVIRVVVGDAQGHPVSGLRKEDFQVLDQGKKQSIAQFDEAAPSEPTAQTLATGSPQTAVPPATRAAERYIALYFDNLNSTSADLIAARDAADRLLDRNCLPEIMSLSLRPTSCSMTSQTIRTKFMMRFFASMSPSGTRSGARMPRPYNPAGN
ncbi:MAG: hypothetical protein WCC26_20970 [Terracidiphilus sp.]